MPLTKLSLKFTISSRLFEVHFSGLSRMLVFPCIGGTIGPTDTLGYPKEPTKTEGGLEPLNESDENKLPYLDKYSFQFASIAFRISVALSFTHLGFDLSGINLTMSLNLTLG